MRIIAATGHIVRRERTSISSGEVEVAANGTVGVVFDVVINAPHLIAGGLTVATSKVDFASQACETDTMAIWTATATKRKLLE